MLLMKRIDNRLPLFDIRARNEGGAQYPRCSRGATDEKNCPKRCRRGGDAKGPNGYGGGADDDSVSTPVDGECDLSQLAPQSARQPGKIVFVDWVLGGVVVVVE